MANSLSKLAELERNVALIKEQLRDSNSYVNMLKSECDKFCDAIAELAGVPAQPRPGWVNCIKAIHSELVKAGLRTPEGGA